MEGELLKPYNLNVVSFTDQGIRPKNEDRFSYNLIDKETRLLLIADGMGGYNDGDLAAEIAIESIVNTLYETTDLGTNEVINLSFLRAHNSINQRIENGGCTVGGVLITKEDIYLFWAGDVKIVLNNGGEVFTSKEHTLLNQLRDAGLTIKPQEIKRLTNTVVKSLGGKSNSFFPQIVKLKKYENIFGIICSDGLSEFYSADELKNIVMKNTPKEFYAILNSGKLTHSADNTSVLLFDTIAI